jgi:hypothetical protein
MNFKLCEIGTSYTVTYDSVEKMEILEIMTV